MQRNVSVVTRRAFYFPLEFQILYAGMTEHHMRLFSKVFSTRTLLQIICVLGAVVLMKALSAHYDFSWATALAAEQENSPEGL
jgi:hypothetical protein